MESINVQVDDYLPLGETSRPEDPPVGLVLEEAKTLNSHKDAPSSSEEENKQVSVDIWTILEARHRVLVDVWMIEDCLE